MKSCYVYEHLEIRNDIPGIVAFALIFVERREILEKRSKSDEIVNWCPDFASRYEMTWRTIELGNHYALIRGFSVLNFLTNFFTKTCVIQTSIFKTTSKNIRSANWIIKIPI